MKYLFPAIDLRDGQVVRLYQGDYSQQKVYGCDPVGQAKLFAEAGASWLHVVDLDGARTGRMAHASVVGEICREVPLKVEVGGGVRSTAAVDDLLAAGVQRVIVGTAALKDWAWFERLMSDEAYHGRVALGLDARNGNLAVQGWELQVEETAQEVAKRIDGWPVAAIIYTDIATDGTMAGPSVIATRQLAESTRIPVVASGGVGSLDHLRELRGLPVQGAIIGRALYEGAFTIEEAVRAFEQGQ